MSLEQTEDLKAFERRLTEVIAQLQPATSRWRLLLFIVSICTASGAWTWLWDPQTSKVSFTESLMLHPFFTLSCLTLVLLFICGIHKRVVAPSIIANRCRQVLTDYNMSCDDTGKLILKPRPASTWHEVFGPARIATSHSLSHRLGNLVKRLLLLERWREKGWSEAKRQPLPSDDTSFWP